MKKPSKKLLKKAGLLEQKDKDSTALLWLRLFNFIRVAGAHFTSYEHLAETFIDGHILADWCSSEKKGIKFNLVLNLNNEESHFTDLSVQFFANDKAEISKDVFQGKIPKFLKGNSIFGFKGTWEEVTEKIIELNSLMGYEFPYKD